MEDVEDIVAQLEMAFHCTLDITTKVGVYVHLSCLIECLILRQEITDATGMEDFVANHEELIAKVREAFSGVEYRYSVEIPIPEICYVLNYFDFKDE